MSMGLDGLVNDLRITDIQHPSYSAEQLYWEKWRFTYLGGEQFLNRYLQKFTKREDPEIFKMRQNISYVPAFAKTAVKDVKNALFQRCVEISRSGGPKSYQDAVNGVGPGVDRLGSTMNSYVGRYIIPELLSMSKVGVYVDRPPLLDRSLHAVKSKNPYLYFYQVEDIRSWTRDETYRPNEFTSILLRDRQYELDEKTNLPCEEKITYRHLWINENEKVTANIYDDDGKLNDTKELDIDRIPFVLMDIGGSLLEDVANYQIALMNLASSDIMWSLLANFPFYVEQYDPRTQSQYIKPAGQGQGLEIDNTISGQPGGSSLDDYGKTEEILVGPTTGRRYPKDTNSPQFIHPSSEPLQASMEKQEQMKHEIRELVNQKISEIGASADSKRMDQSLLENGLAFIGLVLESGERQIASYWSMYEGSKEVASIAYPETYSIKSEEDRRKDAESLRQNMVSIPSLTFKKEMAKELAATLLGCKISRETLDKIKAEIDEASGVVDDPAQLTVDVQEGLVSPAFASVLRGYPEEEAQKAEDAHGRKLARIATYQSVGAQGNATGTLKDAGARGVSPLATDSNQGSAEKAASRDRTQAMNTGDGVRGGAK